MRFGGLVVSAVLVAGVALGVSARAHLFTRPALPPPGYVPAGEPPQHAEMDHAEKDHHHHLHKADDWFERYGDATVFFSRLLPIVRTFISLPAGVAKMPFLRFTALTTLGCIPWVFMLAFIGKQAGDRWESWKDNLHYIDYAVVAAIFLGAIWLFVRYRRRRSGGDAPAADASSA